MTIKSGIAAIAALVALCLAPAQSHAAKYNIINSFTGGSAGNHAWGGLARDAKGNLYGTTIDGGTIDAVNCPNGCGVVYQLVPPKEGTTAWTRKTLHRLVYSEGAFSYSNMVFGPDGALYGFTSEGGANGKGTAFRLLPPGAAADRAATWTFEVIHDFGGKTGDNPYGDLLIDSKGVIYGMTYSGATNDAGTVFKLTPRSSLPWRASVLHTFTGADGSAGEGGLVMDAKGRLFGATSMGGANDKGVVFRLTPPASTGTDWTYKVLHSFAGGMDDGQEPYGSLVLVNGRLLGTSYRGGQNDKGTIYQITPSGTLFSLVHPLDSASDGASPYTGLTATTDGSLFGITYLDGPGMPSAQGTLFKLTFVGDGWAFSVAHAFTGAPDGDDATGTLLFDGTLLYGTTNYGGANDKGMVFTYKP
jgi:uncharacterized repeat protein (TIGR03803 family)